MMIDRETINSRPQRKAANELEFSPGNDRPSRRFSIKENSPAEDVIGVLASAYENERARQVTEWETMGRLTFRQAA